MADRAAVVGLGAVGSTMAASLERAGRCELVLCARRPDRVVVDMPDGEAMTLQSPVVTDPAAALGPMRWVFLAVKAYDTQGAEVWLRRLCGEDTTVVILQNGVEHCELVAPLAGTARLLPAIVWFAAERSGPARVGLRGTPRVTVPSGADGRALARLLDGSPAQIDVVDDFLTEGWRKLCVNGAAGLMALCGRPAEIFRREDIRAIAVRLAAEVAAVGRAEGAALPAGIAEEVVARFAASSPDMSTSILADRLAGRPLEWEARHGVVQRRGARHGVATPVTDVIAAVLAASNEAASR